MAITLLIAHGHNVLRARFGFLGYGMSDLGDMGAHIVHTLCCGVGATLSQRQCLRDACIEPFLRLFLFKCFTEARCFIEAAAVAASAAAMKEGAKAAAAKRSSRHSRPGAVKVEEGGFNA